LGDAQDVETTVSRKICKEVESAAELGSPLVDDTYGHDWLGAYVTHHTLDIARTPTPSFMIMKYNRRRD